MDIGKFLNYLEFADRNSLIKRQFCIFEWQVIYHGR